MGPELEPRNHQMMIVLRLLNCAPQRAYLEFSTLMRTVRSNPIAISGRTRHPVAIMNSMGCDGQVHQSVLSARWQTGRR
jgi:hypothetical protein